MEVSTKITCYGFLPGICSRFFSEPPNSANLFALSQAIKDSRPSLTKAVFSEIPVSFAVFSRICSSMFNVVLMGINVCLSFV